MSSKFGTALEANSINLDSYAKKRELFVVSEEKLDKAGGDVEGHIDMNYHRICHLGYDGVSSTCVAPTGWVTSEIGKVDTSLRKHVDDDETRLMVSGTLKMKGNLDMGGMEIVNVKQPSRSTSVVTSQYLNTALSRTLWTSGLNQMKGNLDMGGMEIVNVKQPSRSTSVVTSQYLNTALSRTLWTSGLTQMKGNLNIGLKHIINLRDSTEDDSATTKEYVDRKDGKVKVKKMKNIIPSSSTTPPEATLHAFPIYKSPTNKLIVIEDLFIVGQETSGSRRRFHVSYRDVLGEKAVIRYITENDITTAYLTFINNTLTLPTVSGYNLIDEWELVYHEY